MDCYVILVIGNANERINKKDLTDLTEHMKRLLVHCDKVEVKYPSHLINNNILPLLKTECTYGDVLSSYNELQRSIEFEFEQNICVILTQNKSKFITDVDLIFNSLIREKIPETAYEIEQAKKCFAFGIYTACVFHLMRVLELGLVNMGKIFSIDTISNWKTAIDQIDSAVRNMNKNNGENWKEQQRKYAEACAHFYNLKDAWRNHTMHVKQQYDEDRAKKIMESTSNFMEQLVKIL